MWNFWILICTVCLAESYKTETVELLHGQHLTIKMPGVRTDSLEFTSAEDSQTYNIWPKLSGPKRGMVTGQGDNRRFVINSVNFDDQGTYTQHNIWNKLTHVTKVKVNPKRVVKNCVPGETLQISLDGLKKDDVSLRFFSEDAKLLLVQQGSPVGNLVDFFGRIKVTISNIQVLNVNVSDVGNYTLYDGKNRKVMTTTLHLVDHHEGISAGPLMALLMLLGIPVGVCCCCRKRIFKKNQQPTAMPVVQTDNMLHPAGSPPAYNSTVAPAGPGPIYSPGYPGPSESTVHPPPNPSYPQQPQYPGQPATLPYPGYNVQYNQQNPMYPPVSGVPSAQPPQCTGPPNNPSDMYTSGYPSPGTSIVHHPPPNPSFPPQPQPQYSAQPAIPPSSGFAPVMYNAPPGEGSKEEIKMNEMSSATPLLEPSQVDPPPAPYTGADVLSSSNSAVQFNIDTGKGTSHNFL